MAFDGRLDRSFFGGQFVKPLNDSHHARLSAKTRVAQGLSRVNLKWEDSAAFRRLKIRDRLMHLEFVVLGPPISNQSPGSNLANWRATVQVEAKRRWNKTALSGDLKAILINFHLGKKPSIDVDNMSKPILDVMQQIVFEDDRQIRQAEISHVRIDAPLVVVGASMILVAAVQAGNQFVDVRIEDPVDPFPLPK